LRPLLAYLIAPLAGLALFTAVWALPVTPYAGADAAYLGQLGRLALGIVVPAFVLVLALSLGVMYGVRARFGGAWWAAAAGGLATYLAAFALLALKLGFATVFANPFWLGGLLAGGLVHGLVFRGVVGPDRRPETV
jgi:hypothetical protein